MKAIKQLFVRNTKKDMNRLISRIVLTLIFTMPVLMSTVEAGNVKDALYTYEKLMKTADETGYAKVIIKLNVKNIKKLIENSTRYKTVEPGRKFSPGSTQADLDLESAINKVADTVLHRLNGMGYRLNHTYDTLPYLAIDASPEALAFLLTLDEVLDIYEDRARKLIDYSFSSTNINNPSLNNSISLIGADNAWAMGYTGKGWYVAILDTGIRRTHQFFQGKTIVEACFSARSDCPDGTTEDFGAGAAAHYESNYDGYDHGTHVAGISAGKYESLGGVAKNSKIIAVQVFSRFTPTECEDTDPCVMSYDSDQVKGLEYIYSLRGSYSIAAVNMSLGGGSYSSYCDSELQKASIDNLKAVCIATVIATGNDSYCGSISSPACISSAVAVGASDDSDVETYFNNWHGILQEFFAPGSSIYSSTGGSNSSYASWSGTSMATPHVTGAWALLKQASPTSNVDKIFNALSSTGVSITTLCPSGGMCPRIQVDEAIDELVGESASITVTSPNGGENWDVDSIKTITWTTMGTVGDVKIEFSSNNGGSWSTVTYFTPNNGTYSWTVPNSPSTQCLVRISEAFDVSPSDISNGVFSIIEPIPPEIALNRTQFNFGAIIGGTITGSQFLQINNSGGETLNWNVSNYPSWISCSPTSGTNAGIITISVNSNGLGIGTYTDTISVTSSNSSNSLQIVSVNLIVKEASQDDSPFGDFSTPTSGSTVRGSVPVTGWVLDDVEVESVKIYNGDTEVGKALFIEDVRPDIEQIYPHYPNYYKAGWGYMLLTNILPNGGNGTYTLYVRATDSAGNQVTLGSKTIYCDNKNAVKPFGAIDTPGQGGTASGSSFINWGWVLTPQPNKIPTDGSTITVWVDGKYLGHPTYNRYRADIATLFPGYANSNGAVGYFYLDTTACENGIHTIQWTAKDSAGNTDGIGSRYFTIQNSQGAENMAAGAWSMAAGGTRNPRGNMNMFRSDEFSPVGIIKGYGKNLELQRVFPDNNGIIHIIIKELERLEIHLKDNHRSPITHHPSPSLYMGFLLVDCNLKSLPIGSTIDIKRGIFYWQPGVGFSGNYDLIFIKRIGYSKFIKKKIRIKIAPKFSLR